MCIHSSRVVTGGAAFVLLIMATSAPAALAPNTIKKMKDNATDVVTVTIATSAVTRTKVELGYLRKAIKYEAIVNGVVRSKSGTKRNDHIVIESYRELGLRPPGPANPPELKAGWKGTVFLNKAAGVKRFRIGVYGHSFEPSDKAID